MSASTRFFVSRVGSRAAVLALACLAAGACTTVQTATTGKSMAPEVASISRAEQSFPSFADIPPEPKDLRPLAAWGKAADATEADRLALEGATADNTWTLTGTEAFAAKANREAGPAPTSFASTTPATEAYVRELRRRATPPSPPKR